MDFATKAAQYLYKKRSGTQIAPRPAQYREWDFRVVGYESGTFFVSPIAVPAIEKRRRSIIPANKSWSGICLL